MRFAIQLQAGKYSTATTFATAATGVIESTCLTSPSSNDDKSNSRNSGSIDKACEMSNDQLSSVGTNTISSSTPSNPLPSITTSTSSTSTNRAQIILSQWALDTAFSTILKLPTPRMGRPAVRKIDEILSMVTDKHEKSLVGNVISPQDIGVTYDMIGKFVITMRSLHDVHIVLFLCI